MNNLKYQQALNNLIKISCPKNTCCNKCRIRKVCNCEAKSYIDALQELIDKATPKKPKGISVSFDGRVANCPCCNIIIREQDQKSNICKCGQIIDWSEEDE